MRLVVDIGGTQIRVGLPDSTSPLVAAETPTGAPELLISEIVVLLRRARASLDRELSDVAVGSPGLVLDGKVMRALFVPLDGVDLRGELYRRLGVPVQIHNDVDAQAAGDPGYGDKRSFFVISVGTAIGGALVNQGVLATGRAGSVSEIGHVPVATNGSSCVCGGVDCLEVVAGGKGLARRLGDEWWARSSREADEALRRAGVALSRAVRTAAVLNDLEYVVLLGSIFRSTALWDGFFSSHCGLGADVPVVACRSTWAHSAAGLQRLATDAH